MFGAETVKQLREQTGAGIMDCKRALQDTHGDIDKAIQVLREKGLSAAAKKANRVAAEGIVHAYIHGNGRIGVLIEVNTETDFVAGNEEFKIFVNDMAMQVAASNPKYLRREEVPVEILEEEKEILRAQAAKEGKPENIVEKVVEGRVEKFFRENCLVEQPFIKDQDRTVLQVLNQLISTIGENIVIRRFVRFERGEGLQKKEENFADEVQKQIDSKQ